MSIHQIQSINPSTSYRNNESIIETMKKTNPRTCICFLRYRIRIGIERISEKSCQVKTVNNLKNLYFSIEACTSSFEGKFILLASGDDF